MYCMFVKIAGNIFLLFPPTIFSTLSGLVEFDGFYLESDPCLVCNNPEVPFSVSQTALELMCTFLRVQFIKSDDIYCLFTVLFFLGRTSNCPQSKWTPVIQPHSKW